jgi:hypothetical protein
MENTELPKDTVRELYLEKCTPEQHIELLELEIKMNEEKMRFYDKSSFHKNPLEQIAMMNRYKKHIENKRLQIKKLQKKI